MRRKRDRDISVFSLSFLDCISCGFGAIILLFVISLGSERITVDNIQASLLKIYQQRMGEIKDAKSQRQNVIIKNDELKKLLAKFEAEAAALEIALSKLDKKIKDAKSGKEALVVDIEENQKEIDSREKKVEIEQKETPEPIGVPVASNRIIFVMDTSGSMRNPSTGQIWPLVYRKIRETLNAYPIVESIQFFDADGNYIIKGTRGQWIPDSPKMRNTFTRYIQTYAIHSQSNPVPGIMKAIRTFTDPTKPNQKVAIYVFGDEFVETTQVVLNKMDKLNPRDKDGNRLVTINAIGFPHVVKYERHFTKTGKKFANLMRELTYHHDGAFIGIQD